MSTAIIKDGDSVVLKKGTNLKFVRVKQGKKDRMENFIVEFDSVIGQPFGSAFHVDGRNTKRIPSRELEEDSSTYASDDLKKFTCESDKDNRSLVSDGSSQKLSHDEIVEMKRVGTSGSKIVGQIVENSATFQNKTQYSQDKYIKKKKNRHVAKFQVLKPTAELLCRMMHCKAPTKVIDLRPDSLSQLLLYSNVHRGSNVLLMESCQGLVVGSVMERLGDAGQIVQVYHADFPVRIQLDHFDFPKEKIDKLICGCQLKDLPLSSQDATSIDVNGPSISKEQCAALQLLPESNGEEERMECEHAVADPPVSNDRLTTAKRRRFTEQQRAMEYLKQQNLDSLIMATKLNPLNIFIKLLSFLRPSSPFIVYCQFKEPLMDCFVKVRQLGLACDVSLSETWCRNIQVLPSRTHPQVVMSASGGYLLSGTKIDKDLHETFKGVDDATLLEEPDRKRIKIDVDCAT